LTTLISSPKHAGVDIDIFLEPLMEDMQKLWEHVVNVRDEYKKQHYNLKAIIFYTMNDNTTRLALTGRVKEKTGCLVVDISYVALQAHGIINVAHHREYSPGIIFILTRVNGHTH
jgi:hypothetical protein